MCYSSSVITNMQSPSPQKIRHLFQKDAQCWINDKTFFWFLVSEIWFCSKYSENWQETKISAMLWKTIFQCLVSKILYLNFLKNWPQYHHKYPKFNRKFSFALILLETRSKYISENTKKMKTNLYKFFFS